MRHDSQWHTASPLWDLSLTDAGAAPRRFRQPALLRFAGEGFIDELAARLESGPEGLAGFVAAAERWDAPRAGWVGEDELPAGALKLFQPVHDRFYLVAASLVCRLPGLPDRAVDRSAEETTSFVVRRIEPAAAGVAIDPADESSWRELAWIGDRQQGTWRRVEERAAPAAGEERHKLFPFVFEQEGRRRRLHAGLIPVAGREVYEQAAVAALTPSGDVLAGDPLADPRAAELDARLVVALDELAADAAGGISDEAAREAFLFLLLDMTELLARDLPDVWQALGGGGSALAAHEDALRDLLLDGPRVGGVAPPPGNAAWSALLLDAEAQRGEIFAGSVETAPLLGELEPSSTDVAAACAALLAGGFEIFWRGALDEQPQPAAEEGEAEGGGGGGPSPVGGGAVYVARMVYERPRCGGAHVPEVSVASAPFQLASYFDADAPVRPSRIRLPIDTSIAGLRRFPKSVSFLISEQLRKQVEKIEGLSVSEVEEGELNESGSSELGVIFVMSIPIITICALILLLVIVQLLNIVFWWLPFFKIAIPIKLGGSAGGSS